MLGLELMLGLGLNVKIRINVSTIEQWCVYDCIFKMEILPNNLDARPNHQFCTFEKK